MLRRKLVLFALGLAACDDPQVDVSTAAGGVAPFSAMAQVRLGMAAHELASVRTAARPEGYTGYVEGLAGYSVAYSVPGSYSEEQVVAPDARLEAVSAVRTYADIKGGLTDWRRVVRDAGAKLGSAPACSRVVTSTQVKGRVVEWAQRESSFSAGLYETPASRAEDYAVRLVLTVTRKPDVWPESTRVPCGDE